MIRRLLAANHRASAALDKRLPDRAIELYERYDREAAQLSPSDPELVAADVGGRTCSYAHLLPARARGWWRWTSRRRSSPSTRRRDAGGRHHARPALRRR